MSNQGRRATELESSPKNGQLSPSLIANNNKFADVPQPGLQNIPETEMSDQCDKPHVARENINMVSGYSRITVKRGEVITDRYTISVLLKDGAKIVPVDECCVTCRQKLPTLEL